MHSDRDPIPDVPVVYLVVPNEENIMRICQDLRNQIYDHYYFNFISPISRQKLEDLASTALQSNCTKTVHRVFDQYLNFISLEDDLFVLKHQNSETISYYAINRGDVQDTEIDSVMNHIVESLFSLFVTLGVVPIIRSQKDNAAEMVAQKLDKKIRENLKDVRNNLFTTSTSGDNFQQGNIPLSFQRPLLVLLDRNMDMATPLHHTWTYQALTHDVLDLKLNQIKIQDSDSTDKNINGGTRPKRSNVKVFDLNPSDKFWQQHKGSPFPQVAEAVQEELESYRASEEEVKRLKTEMGLDNNVPDETITLLSDNTAKLTSAVSSLPELLEKKRIIDMHTTIATSILDQIKHRKLDTYFEIEEKIMSKTMLDNKSLNEILLDPNSGSTSDKMRLFLIYYLYNSQSLSESDLKQLTSALEESGCDLNAYHFIKRWKTYSKLPFSDTQYSLHNHGGGTKTVSMFSKLMSQGSQFVMEGVKNLVVKKHSLPITKIVDAFMEMKSLPEIEDYHYFDPKLHKVNVTDNVTNRNRTPFQDVSIARVIIKSKIREQKNNFNILSNIFFTN